MLKFKYCIYPNIPGSNSKECGKFLGWHWTAAFKISSVFLKHSAAESSISCKAGVGPHKQQTRTFGTKVQQINLNAAYKTTNYNKKTMQTFVPYYIRAFVR